jgi:predicted secreted protein
VIVQGKDVVFTVGGETVACARTASLTTSADIGETSTLGTGAWKTYKGLKMSFTLSAAGLVSHDTNKSIAELRQAQVLFTPVAFEFFSTEGATIEKYIGEFIITNISTSYTYNANYEYNLDGQGTGELTITITP